MKANLSNFYNRNKIFFALFALAAILRLVLLPVAFYGVVGELYRDMLVVWKLFHLHQWPLLGPSSALGNFYFGAVYYYIEAVFVRLLAFSPVGAVFTSTVFSLASLPLLYMLCRKWFVDSRVAVLAVAIQAVALFDIQNAYYVSNPNLLPFFFLALCLLLTKLVESNKGWVNYLLLGLVMGAATQLHATALVLMPVVAILTFIVYKIKPRLLQAFVFCVTFAGTYTPYIIYEFEHHFALTRALLQIGQHEAATGSRFDIILGFLNFFGSLLIFKDGSFNFYPGHAGWFFVAVALAAALVIIIAAIIARKHLFLNTKAISPVGKSILLFWFLGGLLMFLVFPVPPTYYYFILMWPLPAIIFAWWLAGLRQVSQKSFWLIFGGYVLLQCLCLGVFFSSIYKPDYSYKTLSQIFSAIKPAAAGRPYAIINKALDVNQFLYYLTFFGLNQHAGVGSAETFFIKLCAPETNPDGFTLVKKAGNICLWTTRI
jgi:4-amino-4-deoxy-L-arabinose transferase-like glycosyltransferase